MIDSTTRRGVLLVIAAVALGGCPHRGATGPVQLVVAISTLLSHPALDEVIARAKQEIDRQGFHEGTQIRYVMRNANGQPALMATIAAEIAAQNPDVTVAVTTPMAQAVVHAVPGKIVFAAVTDPVSAGVVHSMTVGERRITGVADAWPYEAQLRLIRELFPQSRRIGVLFNPGESAGRYGLERIRALAPGLGFEIVEGPVSSTNDVPTVAASILPRVDVLYPSSDNTVISGMPGAIRVANEQRKPVVSGESGTVEHGAVAAVSVGYGVVGRETGALVVRMLRGEDRIPTVVASDGEVYLNIRAAEALGITIPPAVRARARRVYETIQ